MVVGAVAAAVAVLAVGLVLALGGGGEDDDDDGTATPATEAAPRLERGAYTPSEPGTEPMTGVYRTAADDDGSAIGGYAEFLGRQPDLVLVYQDVDTWANQTWPDWQADAWAALPQYRLSIGGTGIFPQDGSWQEAASGAYDEHWRALGERLVAKGQPDAILRGAHEFNGDWFHYRVGEDDVEDFVAAWRRWVDVMRAVPGQSFTFDWNPIIGTQYRLPHPEVAWPGDEYVDRVALDVYDGGGDVYPEGFEPGDPQPTQEQRDAAWEIILNGERGMNFWRQFAEAHGKPLSLPEWGIQPWVQEYDGRVHGGGDNAAFVERMADIIFSPEWNVAYHAFWEDEGYGVSDPDSHEHRKGVTVTEARQAFLERFAGPALGATEP
jgi:hypothetical protein